MKVLVWPGKRQGKAMRRAAVVSAVLLLGAVLLAAPLAAQDGIPETPISTGQPGRIRVTNSVTAGYGFEREKPSGRIAWDAIGEGLVPQARAFAPVFSAGLGIAAGNTSITFGASLALLWLHLGADIDVVRKDWVPLLTTQIPVRRGGPFGRGDWLRIDYRPVDRELQIGFTFNNLFTRYRRTRPLKKYTRLPEGRIPHRDPDAMAFSRSADLQRELIEIDDAVNALDQLLTPKFGAGNEFESTAREYREQIRASGQTFYDWEERYHSAVERAFTISAGADKEAGRRVAMAAERIIFDQIVVPYDRLFGQNKKPYEPTGFIANAIMAFDSALYGIKASEDNANGLSISAAKEVFRSTTSSINKAAENAKKRWQQSHIFWLRQGRLVWLPLNYGLRPEQRDSQEEVDAIVEQLTGQEFTEENTIEYMLNEQFHLHLKEMIQNTRFYHVLVIHDFRGRYGARVTDEIGWDVVVDGYIRSFVEAIAAYEKGERERIPQFLMYLDETFYQDNKSRKIITYLENLYEPGGLELKNNDVAVKVMNAHQRLRFAIASSKRLAALDEEALKNLFKVHISITNPYDPSFAADSPFRDHRKFTFRDVFENNPAMGAGIFTGQGVGEHYNGPSWEDRSMMVRGPALVSAKTAVRRLCTSQGYSENEVPNYLRAQPPDEDQAERLAALGVQGWSTPLLTAFNETGYGDKKATVLKATLYNLAWRNSHIYSFDSLWISDFWAGMFISAALRGAHMTPVAPAADNAPSSAVPTMALMYANLQRMMQARDYFADDIERADGSLNVGLYANDIPVADIPARVGRFLESIRKRPGILGNVRLHDDVIATLEGIRDTTVAIPLPLTNSQGHKPFIHLKSHLVMNGQALKILGFRELKAPFKQYFETRLKQVLGQPNSGITPALVSAHEDGDDPLPVAYVKYVQRLPADQVEKPVFMTTIGSHNMDRRGMLLDGEVLLAVSGYSGLITLPDFVLMLGMVEWPQNEAELDALYPQAQMGKLSRLFRFMQDLI